MHPIKYIWGIRALIYRAFFGSIGGMTYIGKPCFIEGAKSIYIGSRVRIFPGVRMQTMKDGEILVGNNTAIEQNVHITSAESQLLIGDDVTILGNTFITNIDHSYENPNVSVLEQGFTTKQTTIGNGCFLGFGSAIQAGTTLGQHCVVGAHSVVRGDFPAYSVIVGAPARVVKRLNDSTGKWERV